MDAVIVTVLPKYRHRFDLPEDRPKSGNVSSNLFESVLRVDTLLESVFGAPWGSGSVAIFADEALSQPEQ